jgi:hypothetical protein
MTLNNYQTKDNTARPRLLANPEAGTLKFTICNLFTKLVA